MWHQHHTTASAAAKWIFFFAIVVSINASPFLITDKYIDGFKNGIEELKKLASEHEFHEESFDPSLFNEAEALHDAIDYDFIIVGAGASGAVIANRLSEIPEWKILLLEAGGPETEITQIPKYAHLLHNTPYNWGYITTPQKTWCQGMIDKQCAIETGKALGGSTAINGMIYTRGNAKDYDTWADQGNDGWCYKDVLPYFKKIEDAHLDHFDRKYHNHGGPLHIENPHYLTKLTEDILAAGKELGIETVDYNGKDQFGLGAAQVTTKHGQRNSVAQAYLEPAKKRHNLVVQPYSRAIKIIISEHTKEATGVKYLHDGKLLIAKANKEVILAAGAINTPQLLLLSGIGPHDDLEKYEIPPVQHLNVGGNLKDHIGFIGLDLIYNASHIEATEHNDQDDLIDYLKNGKGPLTTNGIAALGYFQTDIEKQQIHLPDIELIFVSKVFKGYDGYKLLRITPETYESQWKPIEGHKGIGIGVMLTHPKSTGTVTLQDHNPLHYPIINPNQLSDPDEHDIETILNGIRKALSIAHSETLQKHGLILNESPVHGCESYTFGSDDYWRCAIKHLSISLRHLTGSVKMGPSTDKDAVVDNTLKVYGIHKLRVADASVIPVTITGHTMASAIMIGEKASDLIKHTWK